MANIFKRKKRKNASGPRAKQYGGDPELIINGHIREAVVELAEIKKNAAAMMEYAEKANKDLESNKADIARLSLAASNAAKKARGLPEDSQERAEITSDIRVILEDKGRLEDAGAVLAERREKASEQSGMMIDAHNRLVNEINDLKSRRDSLLAAISLAGAQEAAGRYAGAGGGRAAAFPQLNELEALADELHARSRVIARQTNSEDSLSTDVASDAFSRKRKVDGELNNLLG